MLILLIIYLKIICAMAIYSQVYYIKKNEIFLFFEHKKERKFLPSSF